MWTHSKTEVVRVSYKTLFAPEKFKRIDSCFGKEAMGKNYPLDS